MTPSRSAAQPGSHYRFRDASVDALGPGWVSISLGPDASRPVLWYREELQAVVLLGENRILTGALASLGFALVYRGLDHRVYLGPAVAAAEPPENPDPPAGDSNSAAADDIAFRVRTAARSGSARPRAPS